MLLRQIPDAVRAAVLSARESERIAAKRPAAWETFWRRQTHEKWIAAVVALLGCLALPHETVPVPEALALASIPPKAKRGPGTSHYAVPPQRPDVALKRTTDRRWTLDAARGVLEVRYLTKHGHGRIAWSLADAD